MADVVIDKKNKKRIKPTSLIAACIASYIGSGWALLSGIVLYTRAEEQNKSVIKIKTLLETDAIGKTAFSDEASKNAATMADTMVQIFTTHNLESIAIASMIGAFFCILGVYMMWHLRKPGFYFYLTGVLIGVITLIVLLGVGEILSMGILALNGIITLFILFGSSATLALWLSIIIVAIWLLFIRFYWKQLKIMH